MEEREIGQLLIPDASFLVAAHELKTPLSIIRQLGLTLTDNELKLDKKEQARLLSQINITSERALRLVQDLTKVSRLEDAMFKLEPINPQKVCDDIIYEMRDAFKMSHGELRAKRQETGYSPNLVVANYDLLRSILLNFSDNALVACPKSKVELSVNRIKDKVRISVRDYGEPLPLSVWRVARNRDKVLASAASRPQSSGLGIYIAKNFAKAMNGQIGAIRHKNGNTFFVDLYYSEQMSLL